VKQDGRMGSIPNRPVNSWAVYCLSIPMFLCQLAPTWFGFGPSAVNTPSPSVTFVTPPSGPYASYVGLMFWFMRKRLPGSYLFLSCTRRPQTSGV